MKLRIISIAIVAMFANRLYAQQTDPALTAAIVAQTETLKGLYKARDSTQKKIITAEIAVTAALERVHKVENKILEYLSNAQGVMNNLYQIKRAGELVAIEIPQKINMVKKAIPGNLKGTVITALVSDRIKDVHAEMISLFPFVQQLVSSGSYNVQDFDENGQLITKKHKINLLNSAERFYVANEIVSKLENINVSLYLLSWQIKTLGWNDLWFGLDPDGWMKIMSGKNIVNALINDWYYL